MIAPASPPAGIVPAMGFQFPVMPKAAHVEPTSRMAPTVFADGAVMGEDWTHFQPNIRIRTGMAYAAIPKDCRNRSDKNAPMRPVRFAALTAPVTVSQEGSSGWYEARLKNTNSPANRNS